MVAEKKAGWLAALILLMWTSVLVAVLSCYVNASAKDLHGKDAKIGVKASEKAAPASQQPAQKAAGLNDPIQDKDPVLGSPVGHQKPPGEQGQSLDPSLVSELKKVKPDWNSWKVVATFYGLCLIVFLLVFLLRYKPIDVWLGKHDLKGLKPHLSAALGVAVSFTTAWVGTETWLPSFICGLLGVPIGLSSVGLHQLLTKGK